jgi:hypothetical protein
MSYDLLYGTIGEKLTADEKAKCWADLAADVSSVGNVTRTVEKCKKKVSKYIDFV